MMYQAHQHQQRNDDKPEIYWKDQGVNNTEPVHTDAFTGENQFVPE
jgi:hypothetical protein